MISLVLAACGPCARAPSPKSEAEVVVLVSIDTLRADALGCYGGPAEASPHLDALAAQGVRAAWALAPSPTTLASHTSIMSGLDTHGHAVPANGFVVPPDIPLLAERLRDQGWDTIAIVGASALERRMGLDRGFRVYDDSLSLPVAPRYEDTADRVVDRALAQVDARTMEAPLFLFVHLYDPHAPYTSHEPWAREPFVDPDYQGPVDGMRTSTGRLTRQVRAGKADPRDVRQLRALYQAEVRFADHHLGRLLEGLEDRGLAQNRLVVALSDHGEAMEDIAIRAFGHGHDVDLAAIHVPLLLAGTGRFALPADTVIEPPVGLVDVGATILDVLGVPGPLGAGRSLAPAWAGTTLPPRPLFAEASKPDPKDASTWNNLENERGVVEGDALLLRAPVFDEAPALFTVAPGQPPRSDPALETHLTAMLATWDAAAPRPRAATYTEETREALEALGYVSAD